MYVIEIEHVRPLPMPVLELLTDTARTTNKEFKGMGFKNDTIIFSWTEKIRDRRTMRETLSLVLKSY